MRVAVVGGGIFGTTAAIHAARAGYEVHLFEALGDVLQAASAINQYRLHRGYHYPRSAQTAESALKAEISFREEYASAVVDGGDHVYAIAKQGSLVSGKEFLTFCDQHGLEYEQLKSSEHLDMSLIDVAIRAKEARFDPDILRELVKEKLSAAGVETHLSAQVTQETVSGFNKVIIAAYAGTGRLMEELVGYGPTHQYEVCEKPVIALPESFGRMDVVIMDGPFMCVDPLGQSDTYVLGNVVHAIHASNVGIAPEVPETIRSLLNKGIIRNPEISNFDRFIETGSCFIPMLREARHLGSLFTIRTVLPGLDATDARPTTVAAIDDTYIKIFSGKIGNCVLAAREAVALLRENESRA